MAILSTTHIHINGNELPYYNSCSLHQELGEHHSLDLHCLLETIQKFCDNSNQEIEELLGTVVTIETKSYANLDFHGTLKFKGIITGLNYRKGLFSSEGDLVVIKAQSPTIISDDGKHYTSYNDASFMDIMMDNFSNYDTSKLKINTKNSKLTEPLIYTVQYNESCFEFAQRMAARYGEWLYYNGEELVFGLDTKTKELELVLGRDLHDLNTTLLPTPQNFSYFTHDYYTDAIHETESASTTKNKEGYLGILNDSSKNIYGNSTKIWVNISDDSSSKSRLDNHVAQQQQALQSNQIKITGTSDNPGVMLGTSVKITGNTYIITKVSHSYSSIGEYENFFEAMSSNVNIYPKTAINAFPTAQSQTAKIIDNNDPDGIGRVKVQFAWQKQDGLTTPWIRILTPHAGGDKGFHFIPEIAEEVLVDFEGSNAEAPFVMGSLYHNAQKPDSWKTDKNDIKAIRTRSGHTIEFNDANGAEMITITDMNKNVIQLDTAGSSIMISAPENISIVAKNIDISASENLSMSAGENMSASIGEEFSLTANTVLQMANEEMTLQAQSIEANGEKVRVDSTSENLELASGKQVDIQSNEKVKLF